MTDTPAPSGRVRLREDLTGLDGYHSPQVDVPVRLNTNESPYPPPPAFVDEWRDAVAAIPSNRYPDRTARELRTALGQYLGQPPARVFCANGSNEVIQSLLLAYGGTSRRALVFEPTYALHAHIARITATGIITGERRPDFTLEPTAVAALVAAERPDVVFLCSPNNPTGLVERREVVDAVLDTGPGLVVVDEAYAEFAPWSPLELVDEGRSLVVVRTYSKVWSMAALRLGFCVGPTWLVDDLFKVALPYHLSAATQLAGTIALRFRAERETRVDAIVRERDRMTTAMRGMDGIETFPSGANFVLMRCHSRDGHTVWQELLDRGVLVRDWSRWPRLDHCLRVTIGTPAENDGFLAALKEVLA